MLIAIRLLSRASAFGLVKIDSRGRITQFSEKPKGSDKQSMVCLCFPVNYQNFNLVSL